MSSGTKLQAMEEDVQQSKTAVNANAAAGDALPKAGSNASGVSTPGNQAQVEDLGGPTPENASPTNDSAKLKEPGGSLKQVRDVVNKNAAKAEAATTSATPVKVPEEVEATEEEVIAEDEIATDEVVQETTEDEVVAEAPEYTEISIDEDVTALVEGEELSEEFREKAATIFEAAINSKVKGIKEELTASYEEKLVEEVASIKEELKDRVDSYLEYVADEWVSENQLAVESGLKEEMTESFISGMKSLFEEHYVTIPEEKYDVIESMVDKLDEMEGKLNEQIDKNIALNKRLSESTSDVILADVSEGLALSQKDKLASLAENVGFESETDYREKLVTLKESYFPTNASAQRDHSETISESAEVDSQPQVSTSMDAYLQTLSRIKK